MKEIIQLFKCALMAGYEVVKSSSEQVVFNKKDNSCPTIFNNDLNYKAPKQDEYFYLRDEIKRLEGMSK